jgi:small subunit ribosomal protein S20
VAHSLSAKKRIRQNVKRRARNRAHKETLKEQTKTFLATLAKGDAKAAGVELNKTVVIMDRMAAKHTIHKNTAARNRSRLARKLNALAKAK